MKLTRVSIRNFRSIKELSFNFPESGFLVLVGTNNAGKSNIIRAINAICGEEFFNSDKLETHDYYLRDSKNHPRIQLSFDDGNLAQYSEHKSWVEYLGPGGSKLQFGRKIKEEFPCTY